MHSERRASWTGLALTGDFTANPDLDVLTGGIERDLSELLAAAKRHHRRAAAERRPPAALRAFAAVLRFGGRPETVEEFADLGGLAERVDQVHPMSQHLRRHGNSPALVDGWSDRPQQDAVKHGDGFRPVRRSGTDE